MWPEGRPITPFTTLLLRRGSRQDIPSLTTWTDTNRRGWAGWIWPFIKVNNDIFSALNTALVFLSDNSLCAGKRWSTASAYLRPALGRPNLQTEVRCLTSRILFDGNHAVGVEYTQKGQKKRVRPMNFYFIKLFLTYRYFCCNVLFFHVISFSLTCSLKTSHPDFSVWQFTFLFPLEIF